LYLATAVDVDIGEGSFAGASSSTNVRSSRSAQSFAESTTFEGVELLDLARCGGVSGVKGDEAAAGPSVGGRGVRIAMVFER
jgi:hypothetical protein